MFKVQVGSMPEWLMGVDCKSTGFAYAGSNPARPKKRRTKKVVSFLRQCSDYLRGLIKTCQAIEIS